MTWLKSPKGTLLPTWSSQYVNTATVGRSFLHASYLFISANLQLFQKNRQIPRRRNQLPGGRPQQNVQPQQWP